MCRLKCSIRMDFSQLPAHERDLYYTLFKNVICTVGKDRIVDSDHNNELIEVDVIETYTGHGENVEINNKMISACWKIPSEANNENYK